MDSRVLADMIGKGKASEAMLIVKSEMLKSIEYKGIVLTILGTAIISLYSWSAFESLRTYDFLIALIAFFIILFGVLIIIQGNDSNQSVPVLAKKSEYVDRVTFIFFAISAFMLLALTISIVLLSSWHWRNLLVLPFLLLVLYYNHKITNIR